MEKLLLEFDAVHKAFGGIRTNVKVYESKIELTRKVTGMIAVNTKLPEEITVLYKNLQTINFSKPTMMSGGIGWIELVGLSRNNTVVSTIDVNGKLLSNADTVNAMKNPYNIVFNSNKEQMEDYYKKMKAIFEKYASECNDVASVTNIVQEESSLDKIKKLKELLDLGAISQEEFEEKKNSLLQNL